MVKEMTDANRRRCYAAEAWANLIVEVADCLGLVEWNALFSLSLSLRNAARMQR